jgi:hypothetical protein
MRAWLKLKPFSGGCLDRKLREQFNITVTVAEGAAQHPAHVCPLLEKESAGSPDTRRALAGPAGCS